MSQFVFARHAARHLPKIVLSRLRGGPARPSWTFAFELFATALRDTSIELTARDWPQMRAAFDALAFPPPFLVERLAVFRRVKRTVETIAGVAVTTFAPSSLEAAGGPSSDVTVLYLHGGAYVFGSMRTHGELIARIAYAAPARTVAPEYRLAPEHPFPAALDDVHAVYRALLAKGVDPKRLVVAGDSAGGGLTLALLLRLKANGEPLPAGAALLCPWVDLTAAGGSIASNAAFDWSHHDVGQRWIDAYLNGHDRTDPLVSPLHADLAGLPPLFVQVGGAELFHDQVASFAARAKAQGVDVRFVVEPDMIHDWHTLAQFFVEGRRAIDELGAFVRSVT